MMVKFSCFGSHRALREERLRRAVVDVTAAVVGPDAKAWWSRGVVGKPVLILVVVEGSFCCVNMTTALHAGWKRVRPLSRELDFVVLTADNVLAIDLITSTATPLTTNI